MSDIQRDQEWVKSATPEQIVQAQRAGELIEYLGGTVNALGNPVDATGRLLTT